MAEKNMPQLLAAQGITGGMAETTASNAVSYTHLKNRPEETERMRQKKTEEQIRKNVQEFGAAFPDVYEIPPEVYEDVAKTGATPVVAYQRYLIAERDRAVSYTHLRVLEHGSAGQLQHGPERPQQFYHR